MSTKIFTEKSLIVHLLYEKGYIIPCMDNLGEENSFGIVHNYDNIDLKRSERSIFRRSAVTIIRNSGIYYRLLRLRKWGKRKIYASISHMTKLGKKVPCKYVVILYADTFNVKILPTAKHCKTEHADPK
jgi:hypothetical protein